MLNLSSIMMGSFQPEVLTEFYEKIFGEPTWKDGSWAGWQLGNTHLTIGEHSEVKGKSKEPQRIMLNFETTKVEEEFKRIKDLGAEVIKKPYDPDQASGMKIATFADPDGNYFQLMSPMKMD